MSWKAIVSCLSKLLVISLLSYGCQSKAYHIDFYYVATCPVCKAMQNDIIDEVRLKYDALVVINMFDIDDESSIDRYAKTCSMLEGYYVNDLSGHVPFLVMDGYFAKVGYGLEKDELLRVIDDVINHKGISSELNDFYYFKENMHLYEEGL